jgi:hypothetical protein
MFSKIMHIIKTKPFFLILVPAFFLLKNTNTYFTAIPGIQVVELLVKYLAVSCIFYLILSVFFVKKKYKAALYCFVFLTVYFFYNDLNQFLQTQKWLYPLNKLRWSLSALSIFTAGILFSIYKLKNAPAKAISFLNILLLLFCISELTLLIYKFISPRKPMLQVKKDLQFSYNSPVVLRHPNIYFLLLDEYQGNAGLQKIFHYDNDRLKKNLTDKGFFLPAMARSNYNYTFFSMPSIFNMNYLQGEIQGKTTTEDVLNFSSGIKLMQNANLIRFLNHINYKIVNLSPFTLDESGERVLEFKSIIVEKYLIEDQTFFNVMKEKFGWMIPNKGILHLINPSDYNNQYYNEYIRKQLLAESTAPYKKSRFVYAHFFIPHTPFLKDSSGNDVDFKQFIQKGKEGDRNYMHEHYLSYLKYANTMLINTVDTLIKNDPGSIILIMSDHGYRGIESKDDVLQFDIQFYVRTPEHDYSKWPDTVDAVNAFRFLLNNRFDQKLDYLPYEKKEFQISDTIK